MITANSSYTGRLDPPNLSFRDSWNSSYSELFQLHRIRLLIFRNIVRGFQNYHVHSWSQNDKSTYLSIPIKYGCCLLHSLQFIFHSFQYTPNSRDSLKLFTHPWLLKQNRLDYFTTLTLFSFQLREHVNVYQLTVCTSYLYLFSFSDFKWVPHSSFAHDYFLEKMDIT